jgi:nucleotide-binding universal stress UspA family protein
MITLVPIDGSQSSLEALKYAVRRHPRGELLLLYVAPSGRQGDLERGRFLLEDSQRRCRFIAQGVQVSTRLEVGDPRSKLSEAAKQCDLIVMSAHGENGLPHVDRVSPEAAELSHQVHRPVVLVLPTGKVIRGEADELVEEDEEALTGNAA